MSSALTVSYIISAGPSSCRPSAGVDQEVGHVGEVGPNADHRLGGRAAGGGHCFEGAEHVSQPGVTLRVSYRKGCVPYAQARVPPLVAVGRGTAPVLRRLSRSS